jgi:hypothetical protein
MELHHQYHRRTGLFSTARWACESQVFVFIIMRLCEGGGRTKVVHSGSHVVCESVCCGPKKHLTLVRIFIMFVFVKHWLKTDFDP